MSSYSYGYGSGAAAAYLILILGVGVLMIIAQWRLFTKAGEAGWKCLIPIYGQYVWSRIVWSAKAFWTLVCISLGTGILSGIQTNMYIRSYGSPGAGAALCVHSAQRERLS